MQSTALLGAGLNRVFIAMEATSMAKHTATTAYELSEGSYHDDPYKFTKLGMNMGMAGGSAAFLGMNIAMPLDDLFRNHSFTKGKNPFSFDNLTTRQAAYVTGPTGAKVFTPVLNAPDNIKEASRGGWFKRPQKAMMSGNSPSRTGKFLGTSMFSKHVGMGRMLGGAAAITVGAMVATAGLTAIGSFIDQEVAANKASRQIKYDTRMFETENYDMPVMQSAMGAMQSQYQANVNVARIYHGR